MDIVGEVVELWRYPVKSMLGEACQEIQLEPRGVHGDRLFAVQDVNGKFGSGKDTRRFCKIDGLFSFTAHYRGDVPHILFPDGELIAGDDPTIDSLLSRVLGQPVELKREAAVSHLDAEPVHLITCGSLDKLAGIAPEGVADARRFRPNIVLSTQYYPADQMWLGKCARIGGAEIRFVTATQRCAMVTFAQSELLKAPQVLRHITQDFEQHLGVYAEVVKPGLIRLGDRISEIFP